MTDRNDDHGDGGSRRKLLRNIAVGASAVGGLGGVGSTAAARGEGETNESVKLQEAKEKYSSEAAVRNVVTSADVLLKSLANQGILHKENLPNLDPSGHEPLARKRGMEGVEVQLAPEGEIMTPRISIVAQTAKHSVQLLVYTDIEKRYALVEKPNGKLQLVKESGGSQTTDVPNVKTQDIPEDCTRMSGYACGSGVQCSDVQLAKYERFYCQPPGRCVVGDFVGCGLPGLTDCHSC